jgi:hypothetical protein
VPRTPDILDIDIFDGPPTVPGCANVRPLLSLLLSFGHRCDGDGKVTPVTGPSIPSVVRERASLAPNDLA